MGWCPLQCRLVPFTNQGEVRTHYSKWYKSGDGLLGAAVGGPVLIQLQPRVFQLTRDESFKFRVPVLINLLRLLCLHIIFRPATGQ